AVLAADTEVDVGASGTAELAGHVDQLADADLVETLERVVVEDLLLVVAGQEAAGVVTGEAEGHLGEVVGAEGEELGLLGYLIGGQSRARDLDHGADQVLEVAVLFLLDLLGG